MDTKRTFLPLRLVAGLIGVIVLAFLVFNPFSGKAEPGGPCNPEAEVALDDQGRIARVISSRPWRPVRVGESIVGISGQPYLTWLEQMRQARGHVPEGIRTAVYRGADGLLHQGAIECVAAGEPDSEIIFN
ncbi:MAG TPA: hypothetical protein VNL15_03120 [Dehalococcoidia bacterium]|nr:hypothetical protein [Dehalococcoidia bacterium]